MGLPEGSCCLIAGERVGDLGYPREALLVPTAAKLHRMAGAKAQYRKKGVQRTRGMPVITASTTTRGQAITDLIQSVALEETALSHILNAEGEKIQKMVAMPDVTPEVLLATNKSVESMVNAVSRLEMILQSKLSNFDGCLCQAEPFQG